MGIINFFDRAPRYALGGAICAVLNNVIMIGLDRVGVDYRISLLITFAITAPLGYIFHSAVTFQKARNWERLRRYSIGTLSGFFVSAALLFIFCTELRLPVAIAMPITTVLLFFYNYVLARWAIWSWRLDEGA